MNIILFGPMGGGRDTVADYLERTQDYKIHRISSYITKLTNLLNYQNLDSKQLKQTFAESVRVTFGGFVWNHLLMEQIQKQHDLYLGYGETPPNVVIPDGRKIADLIYWEDRGFLTIGVESSDEARRERLIERDGEDPIKYFNHIIEEEAKVGILQCKYKLLNYGTLEDLYSQIDFITRAEKATQCTY